MGTISVSLKKDVVKRLDEVVESPRSIFTNRSQVISYACLQTLEDIEKEINER